MTAAQPLDVAAIKQQFPLLRREINGAPLVYLDSANTSHKPRQVVDAVSSHYLEHNANVARAMHTLGAEATAAFEGARAKVASFIGAASADEIVFTKNASEALNLAAHTLASRLKPGDEVVVFEPAYDAYVPVIRLNGGLPRFVTLRAPDYRIDWDEVRRVLSPRTRLLIVNSPHNPTGHVASAAEVEALVALAQAHRLPIIADEVFCEFIFGAGQHHRPARLSDSAETSASSVEPRIEASPQSANHAAPLVFTLHGFSKMLDCLL